MCSVYGIKQRASFNFLKHSHDVDCLLPDIAVTFFDAKATDIVFNIITGLVSEDKLFSIDFVSSKFSSFEYSQIGQKKKPQLFKITSPTNEM